MLLKIQAKEKIIVLVCGKEIITPDTVDIDKQI